GRIAAGRGGSGGLVQGGDLGEHGLALVGQVAPRAAAAAEERLDTAYARPAVGAGLAGGRYLPGGAGAVLRVLLDLLLGDAEATADVHAVTSRSSPWAVPSRPLDR